MCTSYSVPVENNSRSGNPKKNVDLGVAGQVEAVVFRSNGLRQHVDVLSIEFAVFVEIAVWELSWHGTSSVEVVCQNVEIGQVDRAVPVKVAVGPASTQLPPPASRCATLRCCLMNRQKGALP